MNKLLIDKSKWGPGPWQDEPDRIEWEHLGFPCLMTRTPMGNWCGYVAVSANHPFYGKHYDAVDVNVHGGLTYSDNCQGHICHVPNEGQPDNVWWFGFDCAHAWDLVPSMEPLMRELGHPNPGFLTDRSTYRDVPYVKKEVEDLLNNFIKNLSVKSIRRIDWAVQGLLVLTIGLNCYIYGKKGHLWAPAAAGTGFNIAALFYGALLRRAYKRNEDLWSMLFEQEKVVRRLYLLLENNKQPAGFANSPINPDRN